MQTLFRRRAIIGYLFLIPLIAMLGVFMFYPIILSVIRSFTNWTGMDQSPKYIGLTNYIRVFTKMPEYWQGMRVNITFAFVTTAVQTFLGFVLACLVINMTRRWQKFYRVALYIPVLFPAAAVAVMWRAIYTPDYGLLNQFLRAIGLDGLSHAWMGDRNTALGAIMVANTWRYVGFTLVLFYVAMLDIPTDVMESASIDGANLLHKMRYFYLPLTRGTLEVNVVLSLTGGLRAFDMFYLLRGPGTSTKVVGMYIYDVAFADFKYGRALAMTVILFIIVCLASIITRAFLAPRDDR